MRRKIILLMAVAMFTASAANAQQHYNSGYKYGLFSNLTLGGSVQYNNALFTDKTHGWGADIRMTKRIGDHWRLRGLFDINNFAHNGHDRYAKGLIGISFDALPFYVFADYGGNFNPSGSSKIGLAADGGIGLNFDIGRGLFMHIEAGSDVVNNGDNWQSNAFVKFGYSVGLGKTKADEIGESISEYQPKRIAELTEENALLKSEVKKAEDATAQLQSTVEQAQRLFATMEAKLAECNEATKQAEENCLNAMPPIYFEYASSFLTPIEDEKVAIIAETIKADNSEQLYMIEGYCSANGDPYKNQRLSEDRARAVYWTLISYGVDETRLFTIGNGMTDKDAALEQRVIVRKAK